VCAPTAQIVINEFTSGSQGWVELYNTAATELDLEGWEVDDAAGGSSPKVIARQNVIAGHGTMLVFFAGINSASADQVRLIDPSGAEADAHANFYSGGSIAGKCFGRSPSGGAWATGAVACSMNAPNR
jgi:hypothetical protein